jgi:hypothetical protein
MTEPLIYKPDTKPSFFNKEALIGALLIPALITGGVLTLFIGAVAGAVGGSIIGKKRIEHEIEHGKVLAENPHPINKDTIGASLTGVLGAKLLTTILLPGVVGALALPIGIATMIGGAFVGGMVGHKVAKTTHKTECEEAKKQKIVHHLNKTVSPDVGAAVEYAMDHDKAWSQQVTQDRMLKATQERMH